MKKVLIILACALISACKDRGACLEGHDVYVPESTYTQMIDFGQGMVIPIVQTSPATTRYQCDRYEFPNGKPKENKNG